MSRSIETHPHGLFFDYDFPRASDIEIRDIACSLSKIVRFAGHVEWFWSVAAHSLLVARIVKDQGAPNRLQLAALLHDAHEAYIGDVPTPLKRKMGAMYEDLKDTVDDAIALRFGLDASLFEDGLVKAADAIALRSEAAALKRSGGYDERWSRAWAPGLEKPVPKYMPDDVSYPLQTEQRFLAAFRLLAE